MLRITSGPRAGQEYLLIPRGHILVGRSAKAAFSMPEDRHMSRHHLSIDVDSAPPSLRNLGSTYGTWNNEKVDNSFDLLLAQARDQRLHDFHQAPISAGGNRLTSRPFFTEICRGSPRPLSVRFSPSVPLHVRSRPSQVVARAAILPRSPSPRRWSRFIWPLGSSPQND
jgi:hypothetical protein